MSAVSCFTNRSEYIHLFAAMHPAFVVMLR
jgi:hypothetical protein